MSDIDEVSLKLGRLEAIQSSNKEETEKFRNSLLNTLENIRDELKPVPDLVRKMGEHDQRLAALEVAARRDGPLMDDIHALKSKGVRVASYFGAILLAIGIATREGQDFFRVVFEKIFGGIIK